MHKVVLVCWRVLAGYYFGCDVMLRIWECAVHAMACVPAYTASSCSSSSSSVALDRRKPNCLLLCCVWILINAGWIQQQSLPLVQTLLE
jgi:hypothetical protein